MAEGQRMTAAREAVEDLMRSEHVDVLRESVALVVRELMEAEVAEQVAKEYDVLAVAALHRVGPLEVGDPAVIVATAADHRGEAFEATRALIDSLKATVPIWKHQRFADGGDEWVGSP